eukprot:4792921-Pyramimonas_sp.AAC.1
MSRLASWSVPSVCVTFWNALASWAAPPAGPPAASLLWLPPLALPDWLPARLHRCAFGRATRQPHVHQ